MRHVSRTHRVALDWLFDRINLDHQIQIRHIDTKHQLADILTKSNFTIEEWNKFFICSTSAIFKVFVALRISASQAAPKKRWQRGCGEHKEENRTVAKSKPTAMNLKSTVSTSSSSVNHPIASKRMGILKASTGKPDARARRNSKPDAASSSQGRMKDAYLTA